MISDIVRREYLSVNAESVGENLSIMDAAVQMYHWLYALSEYDLIFSLPFLDRKKDIEVDLSPDKKNETIESLAEHILREARYDIEFYEKEKNPDFNYIFRKRGYTMFLKFKKNKTTLAQGRFILGFSHVKSLWIYKIVSDMSYQWYYQLMNFLIELIDANYSKIGINKSIDEYYQLKLDYVLTYISYFSNEFKYTIPDDLEGVEYIYTDKGKYLITTREDFLKDKESFFAQGDKIMGIGKELAERVPGLVRKF